MLWWLEMLHHKVLKFWFNLNFRRRKMTTQSDIDALTATLTSVVTELNALKVSPAVDITALTAEVTAAQTATNTIKTALGQ
jgi:hypothetical protein